MTGECKTHENLGPSEDPSVVDCANGGNTSVTKVRARPACSFEEGLRARPANLRPDSDMISDAKDRPAETALW